MKRPRWWSRRLAHVEQRRRAIGDPDLTNLVVIPAEPRCPCAACGRAVA